MPLDPSMNPELPETTSTSVTFPYIRRTMVAGIFGFIPLAVTAFIVYWVDANTRRITVWCFNREIPFLGALIALAAIFVTGMITNSLLGKFFLRILDSVLIRLPVLGQLYLAWKQIALTPGGGTEGTFSHVVLIPDEFASMRLLAFTSGRIVEVDGQQCYCVFIPSSPNPITGRLCFVTLDKCKIIDMNAEEAFKVILSTGNYLRKITPVSKPEHPPAKRGTEFPISSSPG
jgi:uncharacterized membrane protein